MDINDPNIQFFKKYLNGDQFLTKIRTKKVYFDYGKKVHKQCVILPLESHAYLLKKTS